MSERERERERERDERETDKRQPKAESVSLAFSKARIEQPVLDQCVLVRSHDVHHRDRKQLVRAWG